MRTWIGLSIGFVVGVAIASGLIVTFSTAGTADDPDQTKPSPITPVASTEIDPLFKGTVEATEEAIVNAMVAAVTMTGADGLRLFGLPHDELRAILQRYGRVGAKPENP
jgi:D-aminopeptidase